MVAPEKIRMLSKEDVHRKKRLTIHCNNMARVGTPSEFTTPNSLKAGKSCPMACSTRGPATIIALTVETSSRARRMPMIVAPVAPKAYWAAT
jgi:hypothetical protein